MVIIAIVLFVLGLAFGSFVGALVWRLHQQKTKKTKGLSIVSGRSMCVNCKHSLAWYDLIPLLSWLSLGGKCHYCKKPISPQYPIVELLTGLIFAGSYLLWPLTVNQDGQWLLLAAWLAASVGLLALAVYDLRWMLLPNKILYPTLAVAAVGRFLYIVLFAERPLHALALWILSLVIASGFFLALFIVSDGKWIGFGDVRLGLVTGTLLADPYKSLAMIFVASLVGTLVVAPSLAAGKRSMASKLSYGPFLIAASGVMVIFGDNLINWYKNTFL